MASKLSLRNGHGAGVYRLQWARRMRKPVARQPLVRAAILGERSRPMVVPLGLARTKRRNISPDPVRPPAPSYRPGCRGADHGPGARAEWKNIVSSG